MQVQIALCCCVRQRVFVVFLLWLPTRFALSNPTGAADVATMREGLDLDFVLPHCHVHETILVVPATIIWVLLRRDAPTSSGNHDDGWLELVIPPVVVEHVLPVHMSSDE